MSRSSYTASLRNSYSSTYSLPAQESDHSSIYSEKARSKPRLKLPSFNTTAAKSSNRHSITSAKAASGKQIGNKFWGKSQDKILVGFAQILFSPFFLPFSGMLEKYFDEKNLFSPALRQRMLPYLPVLAEKFKFSD